MTLLALLITLTHSAQAADCPAELAQHQAALESAATELETAAANMEKLQLEADLLAANLEDAEDDLDEAEDELDEAVELLATLRAAATGNPEQAVGDYQIALSCFFDEAACPVSETVDPAAAAAAAQGPIAPPTPKKKGLFQKK